MGEGSRWGSTLRAPVSSWDEIDLIEPEPDLEPTVVRPVFRLDATKTLPKPAPLPPPILFEARGALPPPIFYDDEDNRYWSWILTKARRRRRSLIAAVVLLVVACGVLPWAVPQIPSWFSDAVPDQSTSAKADVPIAPPAVDASIPAKTGLSGVRLASAGRPLEVIVPRLHVRSSVVPISGSSGELVPPSDPQMLGWWQEGRDVGTAHGSAVVTGHTVSTGGGAFDHLGELVPGDRLRVRTAHGTIEYVVSRSRDVPVKELARTAAEIFRQTGPGRLVLITCSDFNGVKYLSNSVVYASPVKDRPASAASPRTQSAPSR